MKKFSKLSIQGYSLEVCFLIMLFSNSRLTYPEVSNLLLSSVSRFSFNLLTIYSLLSLIVIFHTICIFRIHLSEFFISFAFCILLCSIPSCCCFELYLIGTPLRYRTSLNFKVLLTKEILRT